MEDSNHFKDIFEIIQRISKDVQEGIYFLKDQLHISMGKVMTEDSHEPTYSWLGNEFSKKMISLNPIDHFKSEQKIRIGKNHSSQIIRIAYVLKAT